MVPNQWHATVHDLVEDGAQVRKRSVNTKACCALWEWIQFKAAKWVVWLELCSSGRDRDRLLLLQTFAMTPFLFVHPEQSSGMQCAGSGKRKKSRRGYGPGQEVTEGNALEMAACIF